MFTIPRITCNLQVISNMLYFYGMCGLLKECLLQRYFSKVLLRSNIVSSSPSIIFGRLSNEYVIHLNRRFVVVLKFQSQI